MHSRYFTCIRIHAAGCLARLDIPPHHGCHIALVVHETCVEVGRLIRVWRLHMGEAAGEGVFLYSSDIRIWIKIIFEYQEMEHGEEIARGHEHMVAKPPVLVSTGITLELSACLLPSNNRIVHDWLVRLVLEVGLPPVHKVWSRPLLHLIQFLLGGPNLYTCVNAIGSQRACSL